MTLGLLVIVPPFVSLSRGASASRPRSGAGRHRERERLNGWIAIALVATSFVALPLVIAYVQSELNKVCDRCDRRAARPGGPGDRTAGARSWPRGRARPRDHAGGDTGAGRVRSPDRARAPAALRDSGGITPRSTRRRRRRSSTGSRPHGAALGGGGRGPSGLRATASAEAAAAPPERPLLAAPLAGAAGSAAHAATGLGVPDLVETALQAGAKARPR